MTKKIALVLLFLLVVIAFASYYFFLPRPIIKDPEMATISSIIIQRSPYAQEDPSDSFMWIPETEEDHVLEKEILTYLSQCQEHRFFQITLDDPPVSWKCMYISVVDASRPAQPRVRDILLGPSQYGEADEPERYKKTVNISYSFSGSILADRLQGNLDDPDSLRTFVLDALNLPPDFM